MARRNIDRQALRQQIQELDINNELKSQLLDAVSEQKKYGLVWENHKEDAEELLREKIPVLTEEAPLRLSPRGEGAPNHILIEGDNLHALSALTYTHEGMVDVIYIDPPYNTGNKDFVYNDSFVDSEDGYRHSKWLSFMEKRLRIAKKLLSDRGVIFISIDDNEQANLKLLCDEVFGESNFMGKIIHKNNSMKNQSKYIGISTEYVLVFCKSIESLKTISPSWRTKKKGAADINNMFKKLQSKGLGLEEIREEINEMYSRPKYAHLSRWNKVDSQGVFMDSDLSRSGGAKDYTIINPETGKPVLIPSRGWGKSYEELLRLQSEGLIWYGDNSTPPRLKSYLTENSESVFDNFVFADSAPDKKLLEGIFGYIAFDYPKPLELLKPLLSLCTESDFLILDFFAGSGTTLHATMQLNAEDGGKRQCILVTNNENNICKDVTYERNKRVIQGYTTPKGVEVEGLKDNNLRYYKVDFVDRENSHNALREQAYAMTDLLCIKEGVYTERTSFGSLSLESKEKMIRYFADQEKQMLMLYDSRVIPFVVSEIAKMDDGTNIKVYLFADGSYPYTADFDDVLNKVTLIAMPYAMNSALKTVLPTKEEEIMEGEPENIDDND